MAIKNMTVLVTGGAGYVGSHVVYALLERNHSVIVIDDLSAGFAAAIPADVTLIVGDCGNQALVGEILAKHQVRAIMHFAAATKVPESVRQPLHYYENNTVKSRSLLEAAVKAGVRQFVFSSTAAVYGNPLTTPVSEDTPANPISPYGSSKLMTETMLRDVGAAHDLRYVILRYFNVAGADSKLRTGQSSADATHLVKVAAQVALGTRPGMEIFGTDYETADGTCIRDYIHVSDLANAHVEALRYLDGGGASTILNCGYGHGYSVMEVIDSVKRISARNFDAAIGARRIGDPSAIVADTRKIRRVLGWSPDLDDLDTIVRDALAWEHKLVSQNGG